MQCHLRFGLDTVNMSFPCPHCKQQYARVWNLNRHIKNCSSPNLLGEGGTPSSQYVKRRKISECSTEDERMSVKPGERAGLTEEEYMNDETEENVSSSEVEFSGAESALDESELDSEDGSKHENSEEHNVDSSECSSETSDDEDDWDGVEIAMNEDDRREIRIRWYITRAYRITFPWIYWGELPRIKKHIRWIERLQDAENTTVMYNIRNAPDSQIAALCEIAYNYLHGNIPDDPDNWKLLKNQRRAVRLLASADIKISEKRDEILRRGASFVQSLILSIGPLIISDIPRTLVIESSSDDEEEEEMS